MNDEGKNNTENKETKQQKENIDYETNLMLPVDDGKGLFSCGEVVEFLKGRGCKRSKFREV
jgi:hypothetical protein